MCVHGNAVLTSKPLPAPGKSLADSHVLRSENIDEDASRGKEIQTLSAHPGHAGVSAQSAGLPPSHPGRRGHADRLRAEEPYRTLPRHPRDTHRPERRGEETQPRRVRDIEPTLLARFEPKTSQLADMQQTGNFTYQEGDRKAHADKASSIRKQNDEPGWGRAGFRRHRRHRGRPYPAGPAHRRFPGQRQRELHPPARQEPEERLQHALRRRAHERGSAEDGIEQSRPQPSTTRAPRACGRAPTASARTASRSTATSTPSWPMAMW